MRKILLTFVFITIMWVLFRFFVRNITFIEFVKSPYSDELISIITKISYYDIYLDKIKQLEPINIFDYEFSYLFLIEISIGFIIIIAIIIIWILFFKKKLK
jgi:hypothetical protein